MKVKNENWALMMSAVKQYYQEGLSQEQIAKNLYISKSTVSRLIKKAVDLGYIEFKINNFGELDYVLQEEMENMFGIKCYILPTLVDSYQVRLNDICAYAAQTIFTEIEDNEIICLPWGRTTEYLAANINKPIEYFEGIKACILNGFVNGSVRSMKAIHIIEKLSEMLNATGYVMPTPLLLKDKETKEILLNEPSVKEVFALLSKSETVIFSVGPFDMKNTYLTELGEDVISYLRTFDGAGNFAGHTYDINGVEFQTDISKRLMSMSIRELKKKKNRICIAVGSHKVRPVLGLLRGGVISCLYTDVETVREILDLQKKLQKKPGVKGKKL